MNRAPTRAGEWVGEGTMNRVPTHAVLREAFMVAYLMNSSLSSGLNVDMA
jgi:hypothetical protein